VIPTPARSRGFRYPSQVPALIVFLNPKAGAGHGNDVASDLARRFADAKIVARVVPIRPDLELARVLSQTADDGATVVAAGGDGTVSTVAALAAGHDRTLAVLPMGTLNHFARDAGIPLNLEDAIDVIAKRHVTHVDTGTVNDRRFLNNVSIGAYPRLVETREALQYHGYRKWAAVALAAWHTAQHQHRLSVRLSAEGPHRRWRTPLVLISNNAYDAQGLRVSGRSRLDAGQLYAYIAPGLRARDLPGTFLKEALARVAHLRETPSEAFHVTASPTFLLDVEGPSRVQVAIDGEVETLDGPLRFESHPRSLRLITPAPTA
jgi:diacylglycerol kinase family enzyme